jgi:hypothetical protein
MRFVIPYVQRTQRRGKEPLQRTAARRFLAEHDGVVREWFSANGTPLSMSSNRLKLSSHSTPTSGICRFRTLLSASPTLQQHTNIKGLFFPDLSQSQG